ncbi:MAG: hypothetical protein NTZ40_14510 [Cyanobacteria bacterium]|nr:hypothetical protein [Cyanobacteriota bacterium]
MSGGVCGSPPSAAEQEFHEQEFHEEGSSYRKISTKKILHAEVFIDIWPEDVKVSAGNFPILEISHSGRMEERFGRLEAMRGFGHLLVIRDGQMLVMGRY